MNAQVIRQMVSNLDEEDAQQILQEVDFEMLFQEAAPHIANQLEPHLDDIRHRAQQEDPAQARQYYGSLSEEEQQEIFDETVADLIAVMRDCRERPDIGLGKMKTRIRDPDVLEPLLLIFDNPQHIDPEYAEDMKDFTALLVRWAGAQIIPEAYTEAEMAELQSRLAEN